MLSKGKSTISELSRRLLITPANVYPVTKTLMKKGIIEATFTRPVKLYAVPLNDALDILIMQRKQLLLGDIRALQNIKETITSNWAGLKLDEFMSREIERFQILQGGAVYSKLLALLDNISGSLSLFMSKRNFLDLYKTNFMDKLVESLRKKKVPSYVSVG